MKIASTLNQSSMPIASPSTVGRAERAKPNTRVRGNVALFALRP